MSLRRDDRAVTVQVGAILFFAIVIILLAMYQAQVVPEQNADAEFDHSQQVQDQMVTLRNAIVGTALTGDAAPVTVDLGTRFPSRIFFVNPPPGQGTLRTVDDGATVSISGATAVDPQVREYWNASAHAFDTERLAYRPDYRVYDHAPTTVYGATVLYNRFDDANITLSEQRLVRGNTVTLVTLNGSLSKRGVQAASVSPAALSAATNTVTVRNETGEITLELDSRLPADTWRDLLADQSRVDRVEDVPDGGVRILLKPGTYELRMAHVGLGEDTVAPDAHYAVSVTDTTLQTDDAGRAKLVVEVRDRYHNPVSNASVTFDGGTGDFEAVDGTDVGGAARTDASGRATLWYNASSSLGVSEVTATLGDDATGAAREQVTFRVVNDAIGRGGAVGGAASFVVLNDTAGSDGNTVSYVFRVKGSAINVSGIRLSYFNQYTNNVLEDGPNAIERVELDGETRTITAEEGSSPAIFDAPLTLQPGDNEVTFTLDESYEVSANNEAAGLDVTLYFEGGLRENYPAYLFGPSSAGNTAPTVNDLTTTVANNDRQVTVDWNVSDAEGWGASANVNVTVERKSTGEQRDSADFTPTTNPYEKSTKLQNLQSGRTYVVTLTVRDGSGGVTTVEREITT